MGKTRILFFHFDLGNGGAEKVLVNLVNNLSPEKYDITVKTLFNFGVKKDSLKPYIKREWVLNMEPFRGISFLLKLAPPKLLHKLFIKDRYDYEIAYLESIPTRIISGCNDSDTKCYAWVHRAFYSEADLLHSYRSKNEIRGCYNRFDGIAFVSKVALEVFKRLLNVDEGNLQVVNNVLEIEEIIEASKLEASIYEGPKINFCSVGRLTAQKNYTRLFKVLGALYKEGMIDWHFYLLGQGEEKTRLEEMADKLNLCDNITMVGFDPNPYRYVSKMDFFVCSSLYEGYSTAVSESIILHTPVLTTDCSGMAEIFGDSGCGLIVENSEEGLYDGLRKMLTDFEYVKQMKICAITRSNFFSKERCVQQFEKFIEL